MQADYRTLLDQGIAASLGEVVDDLREAALERVRERASAHEIVDVLEPVLEEDAHALVASLWRALLIASLL